MNLGIIGIVFGVIFIAELPDKSMFAALILGTRYRNLYVWVGAATAFLVHVVIAVSAGQAFGLLPHRTVEGLVALLFLAGALLLAFGKHGLEPDPDPELKKIAKQTGRSDQFWKVFGTSFGIVFLGEWGDITQITTANYAAHYHMPLSVGIGATLALWSVTALSVTAGARLLRYIPGTILQRVTAVVLFIFAVVSTVSALRG